MKVKRLKGRGVHLDSIIWKLKILFLNRMVVAAVATTTAIPKLSLTNGHEVASLCHYGRDDPELNVKVNHLYKQMSMSFINRSAQVVQVQVIFKICLSGQICSIPQNCHRDMI